MVEIEIDGKKLKVPEGTKVIDAAESVGIYIPRFCYHKKLSIAANCRMCLVEVEKCPKPMPACATEVCDGMKIFTKSACAQKSQESVMSFLLINHPLDCPICDQAGECELQDLAMGYGKCRGQYAESKRAVVDKDLGPLIATDLTRCIHCTRCIRFFDEIAGVRAFGMLGRSDHVKIRTFFNEGMDSELSGNVIDLCPVGALTSKPFRFKARAWECQARPSISMHDCVGSNLDLHIKDQTILRVVPRQNEDLNEVWLSDRDRFSYEGLNSEERLLFPKIRENGQWKTVDWSRALEVVAQKLLTQVTAKGPQSLGVVSAPSATVEEAYLLQKLFRAKGCHNLDHRLLEVSGQKNQKSDIPHLGKSLPALEDTPKTLLIGSYLRKAHPIISHRLRKATLKGHEVAFVNPFAFENNFDLKHNLIGEKGNLVWPLAGVVKAVYVKLSLPLEESLATLLKAVEPTEAQKKIASWLVEDDGESFVAEVAPKRAAKELKPNTENMALVQNACPHILLGELALKDKETSLIRFLANALKEACGGTLGEITQGPNTAGCHIAGLLPHQGPLGEVALDEVGLSAVEMFQEKLPGYVLYQLEPEFDCAMPKMALEALQNAQTVISFTSYVTPLMETYADVLLPITPMPENEGTFVNGTLFWQSFQAAVTPQGEAKYGWKVLRLLGNLLKTPQCDYQDVEAVLKEVKKSIEIEQGDLEKYIYDKRPENNKEAIVNQAGGWVCPKKLKPLPDADLVWVAPIGLYRADPFVRRAKSLQRTQDGKRAHCARIHPETAKRLQLKAGMFVSLVGVGGEKTKAVSLLLDEFIPTSVVVLSSGIEAVSELGLSHQDRIVSIEPKDITC